MAVLAAGMKIYKKKEKKSLGVDFNQLSLDSGPDAMTTTLKNPVFH